MSRNHPKNVQEYPEMWVDHQSGWDIFSPEVAWFIYDFFKYDLTPFEKLIFYSYYVNGFTFMEIAGCAGCTFQNIGMIIKKIDKKIGFRWKNKKHWKVKT
jgi:hypothetical protein